MLGLVIRAVEAPIALSLAVVRRGAALAGRVAGSALGGLARELVPDGRPQTAQPPQATGERAVAGEAPPAVADQPPAVADEAPAAASAQAPPIEVVHEPAAEPAARGAEKPPDEVPNVAGAEEGATVEHEPGVGTSVRERTPHSALNNPVTESDLTEWPDPYDHRQDPRDPGEEMTSGGDARHTAPGATSTSEPHPSQDPEAEPWEGPKRDKVDK